jgi:hypothetical protein
MGIWGWPDAYFAGAGVSIGSIAPRKGRGHGVAGEYGVGRMLTQRLRLRGRGHFLGGAQFCTMNDFAVGLPFTKHVKK